MLEFFMHLLRRIIAGVVLMAFVVMFVQPLALLLMGNATTEVDKQIDRLWLRSSKPGNLGTIETRQAVKQIIYEALTAAISQSSRIDAFHKLESQTRLVKVKKISFAPVAPIDFTQRIAEKRIALNGEMGTRIFILEADNSQEAESIASNGSAKDDYDKNRWCRVVRYDNQVLFAEGDRQLYENAKKHLMNEMYSIEVYDSYVFYPEAYYDFNSNSQDASDHLLLMCTRDLQIEKIIESVPELLKSADDWELQRVCFNDRRYSKEYWINVFATGVGGYFILQHNDDCEVVMVEKIWPFDITISREQVAKKYAHDIMKVAQLT